MPKGIPAKLKKVSVKLPFGIGGAEWEADITESKAAWSLYVELVTRIAIQDLEKDQGLLRNTPDTFSREKGVKNRQKAIHRIRCQYQLKHEMNRIMNIVHSLLNQVGGFANRKANF